MTASASGLSLSFTESPQQNLRAIHRLDCLVAYNLFTLSKLILAYRSIRSGVEQCASLRSCPAVSSCFLRP